MIDNIDKNIISNVQEHGFYVLHFYEEEDFPAYAHTIGLYENYNHPELVMFGLPEETMHILLSDASDRVKNGTQIEPEGLYDDFVKGYKVTFKHANLDEYKGFFGYGVDFYEGHEFPVLQLVWPDQEHRFPWDEKFDPKMKPMQPLLI